MRIAVRVAMIVVGVGLAGCPKNAPAPATPAAGSGSDVVAVLVKKIAVGFQASKAGAKSEVFLTVTDETGAASSRSVGTYPGECAVIGARPDFDAISAIRCKQGAAGTELQAVARNGEVIVVRLPADEGVKQDPMARDEVMRITAPVGAKIEGGQ
jgi:hypothetical protein